MKKTFNILFLSFSLLGFSQVVIGKDGKTIKLADNTTVNPSVLLSFDDSQTIKNKGLILPYVETVPTDAVGGTLVFDTTTTGTEEYRVRVKNQNTGWTDLSKINGTDGLTTSTTPTLSGFTTSVKGIQTGKTEKPNAKVIVGAGTSTTPGIVVLESTTKAMVLPIVDKYSDIPSPSPGMIVYTKSNKQLAVFNGTKWSFWKP